MVVAIPPRNRSWEHVGDDENSDPARSRALLAQKGEITVTDKEPAGGPTGVDECNRDLDEAAGAADAIACSGGGSLCGMMQELDCR